MEMLGVFIPDAVAAVRIDRPIPAHTDFRLCLHEGKYCAAVDIDSCLSWSMCRMTRFRAASDSEVASAVTFELDKKGNGGNRKAI